MMYLYAMRIRPGRLTRLASRASVARDRTRMQRYAEGEAGSPRPVSNHEGPSSENSTHVFVPPRPPEIIAPQDPASANHVITDSGTRAAGDQNPPLGHGRLQRRWPR